MIDVHLAHGNQMLLSFHFAEIALIPTRMVAVLNKLIYYVSSLSALRRAPLIVKASSTAVAGCVFFPYSTLNARDWRLES